MAAKNKDTDSSPEDDEDLIEEAEEDSGHLSGEAADNIPGDGDPGDGSGRSGPPYHPAALQHQLRAAGLGLRTSEAETQCGANDGGWSHRQAQLIPQLRGGLVPDSSGPQ